MSVLSLTPREALNDFLLSLKGTSRKPNTIIFYRSALRQLVRWMEDQQFGLADLHPRRMRAFFAHREEQDGVCRTTLYHDFTGARKFFQFCRQEGYIEGNPLGDLKFLKPPPKPQDCPDDELVAAFLRAFKDRWNPAKNPHARYTCEAYRTRIGRRDYCIALALFLTGARRGEIVTLRLEDVLDGKTKTPSLRLRETKTGQDRNVPVNVEWIEALNAYLRVRPKSDCPALFLGEYGEPLSAAWFGRKFKAYAAFAGCPEMTPQWLRRFRSRKLVIAGDLWTAALLLGNSPEVLRKHYLARDPDHARAVWLRSLEENPILNKQSERRKRFG